MSLFWVAWLVVAATYHGSLLAVAAGATQVALPVASDVSTLPAPGVPDVIASGALTVTAPAPVPVPPNVNLFVPVAVMVVAPVSAPPRTMLLLACSVNPFDAVVESIKATFPQVALPVASDISTLFSPGVPDVIINGADMVVLPVPEKVNAKVD